MKHNLKSYMFWIAGITAGVILLAVILFLTLPQNQDAGYNTASFEYGGEKVELLISDTEALRSKGLSGRTSLADDEGMLFAFEESGRHSFWMKDMEFPLDIIWLSENFEAVHIEEDVSPDSFPQIFTPPAEARYVIELNAGKTSELGIGVGKILTIDMPEDLPR